jgi:hypothetical protein
MAIVSDHHPQGRFCRSHMIDIYPLRTLLKHPVPKETSTQRDSYPKRLRFKFPPLPSSSHIQQISHSSSSSSFVTMQAIVRMRSRHYQLNWDPVPQLGKSFQSSIWLPHEGSADFLEHSCPTIYHILPL